MKPSFNLASRISLATAIALGGVSPSLAAGPYYWDSNGATAGFATAGGTWAAPTSGWSTDSTGATAPGSVTTATTDAVNFGSSSAGINAGTVTVSGTVSSGNITFASLSGAIVLTGGTITLAASDTITVNNASDTINSALAGAATSLTKAGSGILILGGANTYAGATSISAGTVKVANATALGDSAGAVSVTSGAVLDVNGTTMTNTNALTLNGTGISAGALTNSSATAATYAGLITLGSASSIIASGGNLAISNTGTITGAFGLTLGGAQSGSIASIIGTGAGTVTKQDAGTWTLSGANTYTGLTTVSAGALSFAKQTSLYGGTTASWVPANISVAAGAILALGVGDSAAGYFDAAAVDTFRTKMGTSTATTGMKSSSLLGFDTTNATAGTFTYGSAIGNFSGTSLTDGIAKIGAGTLELTGANTFTGTTVVNAGTLLLSGGSNRIMSGNTVTFDGGNGSAATLDIGSTSQTLGNILFPATGLTATMTANINGSGGTLTLGSADLQLGPAGNNALGTVINMGGLSTFTYSGSSARTFRIGYQSGYGGNSGNAVTASNTTLASGTNTITTGTLAINDVGGSSGAGNALMHLGTTNTINASTINMGTGGRSGATLDFASGLTNPTVKIRATDTSAAVTTWSLGQVNVNGSNSSWSQLADFTAGTIDANVVTMNVGKADFNTQSGRGGTDSATVKVGDTTGANFTVGTLNLGYINGSSLTAVTAGAGASGTFTLSSASGIVNATTINFAKNTIADTSAGTKTVSGTFNLTNGTLNATTVQKDPTTGGTATATVNFNWTTGTIGNLGGGNLSFTAVPVKLLTTASHIFNISGTGTATLDASSPISGATFGITKSGSGTLTLQAVNTYTGITTLGDGTLSVATIGNGGVAGNLGQAGNSAANIVFDGGTLQYTGSNATSNRAFTINTDKTATIDTANNLSLAGATGTATNGALTKLGAGTLTLTGANTYTGLTTVTGGALSIGSGGIPNGNDLTVGAGGTAVFANASQTLDTVINHNTATNALNFSAATGTVTLADLSGSGNTRFGSDGTVTNGISAGTVNAVGLLTASLSGGTVGAGSLSAATVSGGNNTITGTAGITTLSNGTTTVGGTTTIGMMTGGTANLNGATGSINTLQGGVVNLGTSTVLSVSGGTSSGTITGAGGSLTKTGAGTLTLTNTSVNSYTGNTSVANGMLVVNGNISTSALTSVGAAGTLGGTGTVGAATIDGTLSPGNSPGSLTFSGDLILGSGSISNFEINSFASGNFDLAMAALAGSQTVHFNGGTLNLLFESGFNTAGTVQIFNFDVYAGSGFTSLTTTGLASGFSASFDQTTGLVTVVPEPRAALIGGLGMLLLLRRRRLHVLSRS